MLCILGPSQGTLYRGISVLSVYSLSTRFEMVLVTCMDRSALCAMMNDISEQTHEINLVNDNISI
jgi:hypothetical protein